MNQFGIHQVVIYFVRFKVCSRAGLLLCILNRTMIFIEYRIKFKRTTKEGEHFENFVSSFSPEMDKQVFISV